MEPNTAGIETVTDLARALDQLRGSRSQASLTKRAASGGVSALPKSTVSDLLSGPSLQTVVTFLTACGLATRADQTPWLAAWERVANAHFPRPPGAVRVREARPRLLGVHAAIQLDTVHRQQPDRKRSERRLTAVRASGP